MNSNQFKPASQIQKIWLQRISRQWMSLIPNATTQSKSHYILISPPQSLGNGSWIFKDQDYQHSSLSEKVFLSPPLPRPPTSTGLFFLISLRNIIIIKVPVAVTPTGPPLLKEQTTVWTLLTFGHFEISRKLDLHIILYVFRKKFPFRRQNPHWFYKFILRCKMHRIPTQYECVTHVILLL